MKNISAVLVVLVLLLAVAAGGYFYSQKQNASADKTEVSDPGIIVSDAEVEGFVRHDFLKILTITGGTTDAEHMEEITPYVTVTGLESVRSNFMESDLMKSTERTEVSFASEPKVTAKETIDGRSFWTVTCQVSIKLIGGGSSREELVDVNLSVTTKDLNGEQALAVDQMTLQPLPPEYP